VLIANHKHPRRAADGLECIKQSLNRCPRRANIGAKCGDVAVPCGHLTHEAAGHAPKIFGPLVNDLRTRSYDDHAIDLVPGEQCLRDRARRQCLAGTRRGIDQEVAVSAILDQPLERLAERIVLPWPKPQHRHSLDLVASLT